MGAKKRFTEQDAANDSNIIKVAIDTVGNKINEEGSTALLDKLATAEFNVLIWDKSGILFENKGKCLLGKLQDNLSFYAVTDTEYSILYELTVHDNGAKFKFATLSEFNEEIANIKQNGYDLGVESVIYTHNKKDGEGYMVITVPMILQVTLDDIIKTQIGGLSINIFERTQELLKLELDAVINEKRISEFKATALGPNFSTENELYLLEALNDKKTVGSIFELLNSYDKIGFDNLSNYRKNIYTSLKTTANAIEILRMKLANIAWKTKAGGIALPDYAEKD